MNSNLSRRHFLGGAVAVSTTALLPSSARPSALESDKETASVDMANRKLTSAAVAKVKWKTEPFAMTEVRLLPGFWKDMMELNRSLALFACPTSASRTTSA